MRMVQDRPCGRGAVRAAVEIAAWSAVACDRQPSRIEWFVTPIISPRWSGGSTSHTRTRGGGVPIAVGACRSRCVACLERIGLCGENLPGALVDRRPKPDLHDANAEQRHTVLAVVHPALLTRHTAPLQQADHQDRLQHAMDDGVVPMAAVLA